MKKIYNNSFFQENKKQIIVVSCLALIFLCVISVKAYQKYQDNKWWREYKDAQASGSSSSGGIDYTNLHKYSNSTYKIGSDMPAGEYVIFAISNNGYFCLSSDSAGNSIISTSGSGMFKIGTHLSAGEYKLEATDKRGYYCVYGDDRQDDIVYNDNFEGTTYATVKEGQYLLLSRCKIVK